MKGLSAAKRVQGALALMEWHESIFSSGAFPEGRGDKATTRLGLDDRLAKLPEPLVGPFGEPVSRFVVPGWMARKVPADAEVEQTESVCGGLKLGLGDLRFTYRRHGLRLVADDSMEDDLGG